MNLCTVFQALVPIGPTLVRVKWSEDAKKVDMNRGEDYSLDITPHRLNVALSDTLVFLLNEYFIELNTVNFYFLNKFLN